MVTSVSLWSGNMFEILWVASIGSLILTFILFLDIVIKIEGNKASYSEEELYLNKLKHISIAYNVSALVFIISWINMHM